MPLRTRRLRLRRRLIQIDKPRIRTVRAVDRHRAESHDKPQHTRLRIHRGQKTIRAERIADARSARHVIVFIVRTGDALHENCHLLIPFVEAAAFAVVQRRKAHRARIDRPDRILKGFQIFFRRSRVGTENRFVFSRKGIAEAVFQDGTGPHDHGIMAVVLEKPRELFHYIPRETAAFKALGHLAGQREKFFFASLPHAQIPEPVFHYISIENIRPDKIGIMRFQPARQIGGFVLNDFACQQHAAGFAADQAGADHVVADCKIIIWLEIIADHDAQLFIPRHHDTAHPRTLLCCILSCLPCPPRVIEKPVPRVQILHAAFTERTVHRLIEMAGLHAVRHRRKAAVCRPVQMRQKHRPGIAVPHLERPHIIRLRRLFPVRKYIQKHLRGIADFRNCLERMFPPDQRKIRHRIELKQIRACDAEKVAHHEVCRPCRLQLGEAVEHIEGASALITDQIVNRHRKGLKTMRKLDMHDFDSGLLLHQRRMRRETDIDHLSPLAHRLSDKRFDKRRKRRNIRNTKYNIVPEPDAVKAFVHLRDTGADSVKSLHINPPSACAKQVYVFIIILSGLPVKQMRLNLREKILRYVNFVHTAFTNKKSVSIINTRWMVF